MTDPRVAFAIISVRPRLHLIRVKAFCSLLGPQISNQISLALTRFFGIRCRSRLYSVASFSTVFTAHLHPGLSGSLALAVLIAIHVRSKVAPEVGNVARILLHVALPCPLCGAMTVTRTSSQLQLQTGRTSSCVLPWLRDAPGACSGCAPDGCRFCFGRLCEAQGDAVERRGTKNLEAVVVETRGILEYSALLQPQSRSLDAGRLANRTGTIQLSWRLPPHGCCLLLPAADARTYLYFLPHNKHSGRSRGSRLPRSCVSFVSFSFFFFFCFFFLLPSSSIRTPRSPFHSLLLFRSAIPSSLSHTHTNAHAHTNTIRSTRTLQYR